jgi:GAF domain-containing protein
MGDVTVRQPLKIHNEIIGELVVAGGNQDGAHDLLAGVANQLSRHIENIRLAEQTESALGQTESLYQIGHELNTATNVDEILHAALGPIFPTGIDEATMMFIELNRQGQPQTLELLAGWRMDGPPSFPVGTIFPVERFPFTSLFINDPDDPQLIGDAAADPRVDDFTRGVMAHAGIKAIAVIPLTMGGEWVGIITCSWPQPRTFSRQEEEIFNALINMAAPAVQSQRLFFKTKAQADKEHLINEINQRIQNTVSVESALQTAVKELGQALQTKTQVRLNAFAEKTQADHLKAENGAVESVNSDS